MGDWWEEPLPSRPSRRPDLPSETLEAGNRLVVQIPVALEYWMDEGQRAYVLEALHQRLNSEMGMPGFRVKSPRTDTGVVLDPTDPNAELLSLNQPVDEWPNLRASGGLVNSPLRGDAHGGFGGVGRGNGPLATAAPRPARPYVRR